MHAQHAGRGEYTLMEVSAFSSENHRCQQMHLSGFAEQLVTLISISSLTIERRWPRLAKTLWESAGKTCTACGRHADAIDTSPFFESCMKRAGVAIMCNAPSRNEGLECGGVE